MKSAPNQTNMARWVVTGKNACYACFNTRNMQTMHKYTRQLNDKSYRYLTAIDNDYMAPSENCTAHSQNEPSNELS